MHKQIRAWIPFISIVFFASDKPFGAMYFVALIFFFGAVACEFLKHKFPIVSKSQQLEMARKDLDAEKISKNTIEKL